MDGTLHIHTEHNKQKKQRTSHTSKGNHSSKNQLVSFDNMSQVKDSKTTLESDDLSFLLDLTYRFFDIVRQYGLHKHRACGEPKSAVCPRHAPLPPRW